MIVFCFDSYQEVKSVTLHKSRGARGASLGRGLHLLRVGLRTFTDMNRHCLLRDDELPEGGVVIDRPLAEAGGGFARSESPEVEQSVAAGLCTRFSQPYRPFY